MLHGLKFCGQNRNAEYLNDYRKRYIIKNISVITDITVHMCTNKCIVFDKILLNIH